MMMVLDVDLVVVMLAPDVIVVFQGGTGGVIVVVVVGCGVIVGVVQDCDDHEAVL